MSTAETVTLNKGPCPCGEGYIAQHVTTQDNPWSGADVCYSIECHSCRCEWRLDGNSALLVLRSSEMNYIASRQQEGIAHDAFSAASSEVIEGYFASFSAKNKKLEHAEMERLGITSMSYRQYLSHRRNGASIASACHGQKNLAWLLSEAADGTRRDELADLFQRHEIARSASSTAAQRIVRRTVA